MLFRFSIAFLPAFMLCLVIHRVPNNHLVTFSTLREKLLQGRSQSGNEGIADHADPMRVAAKYPAIPIPFLPTPLQYRCPSKIACEASQSDKEIEAASQKQRRH